MQITHTEDMPARIGEFKLPQHRLSTASWKALKQRGISQLFKHQADAIDVATSGTNSYLSFSQTLSIEWV